MAFLCCHLFDNNSIQLTAEVWHADWAVMILADNFPHLSNMWINHRHLLGLINSFFQESLCSIPPSSTPLRMLSTIPMACKQLSQAVNRPRMGETLPVIYKGVFVMQGPEVVMSACLSHFHAHVPAQWINSFVDPSTCKCTKCFLGCPSYVHCKIDLSDFRGGD